MKNITIFHLKIIIFTAVKNRSILHGRVFVMELKVAALLFAEIPKYVMLLSIEKQVAQRATITHPRAIINL